MRLFVLGSILHKLFFGCLLLSFALKALHFQVIIVLHNRKGVTEQHVIVNLYLLLIKRGGNRNESFDRLKE